MMGVYDFIYLISDFFSKLFYKFSEKKEFISYTYKINIRYKTSPQQKNKAQKKSEPNKGFALQYEK
jgi:hypothetical protein